MSFTEWLESLKQLSDVAKALAGLGFVTVLLAVIKHRVERRCWQSFKRIAHDWVERLIEGGDRHPDELSEHDWKAECERMLSDANFSPLQITQLLQVAVVVAMDIASEKIYR